MSRMWACIESLISLVLPKKARSARTEARTVDDFLMTPEKHELLGASITTLFSYKDSAIDDLLRSLKYEHSDHAAQLCADMLAEFLREEITTLRLFSKRPILLVPVPLHKKRKAERGFNQIQKILELLPSSFRDGTYARLEPRALERTRETVQQAKLSRNDRLSNVAGAFSVSMENTVAGAHCILIDDVVTTGATIVNASTPLRKAGAEVTLLAFARA